MSYAFADKSKDGIDNTRCSRAPRTFASNCSRLFSASIILCRLETTLPVKAVTLSPALCGVLLRPHHGPRRGIMGRVMRSIDWVRDRYGDAVHHIVRFSIIGLIAVAASGFAFVSLSAITPTGFLPEDDQGALFVVAAGNGSIDNDVLANAPSVEAARALIAYLTTASAKARFAAAGIE